MLRTIYFQNHKYQSKNGKGPFSGPVGPVYGTAPAQHPASPYQVLHCIYQKKVSEGKYRSHRYFFCPLTGEAEVLTLINFD